MRIMFFHTGSVRRDSEEDKAFMALSISMTTRMDKEMVEAVLAEESENMLQPICGKALEQRWKWVYNHVSMLCDSED